MAPLLSREDSLMDSEHRVLLAWGQEGAKCLQEVRPTEECLYVVDVLAQLARTHVKNEHIEMRACGYPDWFAHNPDHERRLAQLAQMRQSIVNAATGAAYRPAHGRLAAWMQSHIVGCDWL
jgi:hemerythrin-like metal-binding protein